LIKSMLKAHKILKVSISNNKFSISKIKQI
jgi:hypothetical protein